MRGKNERKKEMYPSPARRVIVQVNGSLGEN